jgi:hypothetical protein
MTLISFFLFRLLDLTKRKTKAFLWLFVNLEQRCFALVHEFNCHEIHLLLRAKHCVQELLSVFIFSYSMKLFVFD